MKIKELQKKLIEAYTIDNLNRISLTLINLYRNQQYLILQKIAEMISDFKSIEIGPEGKGFFKLMMLYHPDRALFHLAEINKLAEKNDFDRLLEYSHILSLERIEEIAASLKNFEDIDYSPVYDWDLDIEGFIIINDGRQAETRKTKTNTKLIGYSFYDAIKIREFGNTDIEFPPYYLEDIDEFELSFSDITDLDGIEYCINAKTIDVSNNRIIDLTPLIGLTNLRELNLSDNQIGYIDVLSNLINLISVKLSDNCFEDISPLFELNKLEYADLSGNKIDIQQINKLTDMGVTVDYDN
jgi:Leucine-rich repeat (LRR) protein